MARLAAVNMVLLVPALLVGLCGGDRSARAGEVRVAVSAGLEPVAIVIARRFTARSGHEVVLTAASTGKLYAQLVNGAAFDVFLSADSARPARAEAAGLTAPGPTVSLGRGRLALWSPNAGTVDDEGRVLGPPLRLMRLVVPNPVTSAYGAAADAVLEGLGLQAVASPRVVLAADGAAAADTTRQLAASDGSTDDATAPGTVATDADPSASTGAVMPPRGPVAGLLPIAHVSRTTDGSLWLVPETDHPPLEQQAVLLAGAMRSDAARAFMAFLTKQDTRDILAGFGFGLNAVNADPQ